MTAAQLRVLATRVAGRKAEDTDREVVLGDLLALGYGRETALRIVELLREEELLDCYLRRGAKNGCFPLTRVTEGYPKAVRKRLGLDSPGCIWCKGDMELLDTPKVSLVGSRVLRHENQVFAREVGRQAARQGFTLVSGNAAGADREAQEACLKAGGRVISVVAYELVNHRPRERVLYLGEDGYDQPFLPQRALSRNRVIHSLGERIFVAQSSLETGGTWDGTVRNLRFGWSPVFCFRDGSEAAERLIQMGANSITQDDLEDFSALCDEKYNFLTNDR